MLDSHVGAVSCLVSSYFFATSSTSPKLGELDFVTEQEVSVYPFSSFSDLLAGATSWSIGSVY